MAKQHEDLNNAVIALAKFGNDESVKLMRTIVKCHLDAVKELLVDEPTEANAGKAQAWRAMTRVLEEKVEVDNQEELRY